MTMDFGDETEALHQQSEKSANQNSSQDGEIHTQVSNTRDHMKSGLRRKPHRKSKKGCLNCKRRKVKCDEITPICSNCLRFDIPCSFNLISHSSTGSKKEFSWSFQRSQLNQRPVIRRGPGRPRKNWAAIEDCITETLTLESIPALGDLTISVTSSPSSNIDCSLDVSAAELMLHYINYTANTLSGLEPAHSRMAIFWKHNVLKIAFSYPYVLRLVYSLAAFHLARSYGNQSNEEAKYLFVAKSHLEIGVRQLNEALSHINESNCSALYISALLVSYCSFAVGPKSNNDLLICEVGSEAAYHQLPLIHGVRLIRRAVEPAALFRGYLAPLSEALTTDEMPEVMHTRIDWVEPVERLQEWIKSFSGPQMTIFEQAVLSLSAVYKANYGDHENSQGFASNDRLVFGWLYRLQDPFLVAIKEKHPLALAILAYYVPLLKAIRACWLLEGWPEHILSSIHKMLSTGQHKWLEWPWQVVEQLNCQIEIG